MILSVCGYNCSGSSAVIHLLKEYNGIKVIDFECMLLDMPDGIKDLEYSFFSGGSYFRDDISYERFLKAVKNQRYFQKYSNKRINDLSEKYIESITGVKWAGRSVYDYIYRDTFEKYIWYMKRIIEKLFYLNNKKRVPLTNRTMRMANKSVDFYKLTRAYMDSVIESFGGDLNKINVMDQLMPPVQTIDYLKYVNDGKAIIVDRDPRDMYINLQMGVDCRCVPVTVDDFIKYHKCWWEKEYDSSESILRVQFENLIYKYDETVKEIEKFLNISRTEKHGTIFKPQKSINNTQIFKRVDGFEQDIKKIERELNDKLYQFPKGYEKKLSEKYKYYTQSGKEEN